MKEIFQKIKDKGGTSYFVGGYVRDKIMRLNIESKDIDVEVFGLDIETLMKILSSFGSVNAVGKSFGVLKTDYQGIDFDFSLPRKENKIGVGHKGFNINTDENMTVEEAAKRRDFTMNAISIDTLTGKVIDPYNGTQAIQNGYIKHTSNHFSEDPLRVLRAFQFSARFDFPVLSETVKMCEGLFYEYHDISKERIWIEWEKFLTKSLRPSRGLNFLRDSWWIYHYPALSNLIGLKQEPDWHPEGDVWNHTLQALDFMNHCIKNRNKDDKIILMLAILLHDVGKINTSEIIDNRIISRGHDKSGVEIAERFMNQIRVPKKYHFAVLQLIENHTVHVHVKGNEVTKKMVRRLIIRLRDTTVKDLALVILADHNGRGHLDGTMPIEVARILEIAEEIGDKINPIIMGRHLITIGIEPGIEMGKILKRAFSYQLNGEFDNLEDGLKFIKEKENL